MNARFTERGNDLPLCLADIAAVPLQVAEDNFYYDDCYDGDDEAERGDHAALTFSVDSSNLVPIDISASRLT